MGEAIKGCLRWRVIPGPAAWPGRGLTAARLEAPSRGGGSRHPEARSEMRMESRMSANGYKRTSDASLLNVRL